MNLEELRKKILEYNIAYEKGHPLIEDCVYDFYKKQLFLLEKNEIIKISNAIGSIVNEEKKIQHMFRILSLNHDFGKLSADKFIKKIKKHDNCFPLVAELKIDGVSVMARYKNGCLQHIATRGNGIYGEEITHLKKYIALPEKIYLRDTLEIRFEAYLEKNIVKNPRNAVAGMFFKNNIDPNLKHLKFAPHNLYSHNVIWTNYLQLREIFAKMHLIPILHKICHSLNDIYDFFDEINAKKNDLPFEIDGIVIKINDKALQDKLGSTSRAPRFAIAIKFDNPYAIAKITNIKFQISRFGKITPVAEITETIINERKITKATLNNISNLENKKYQINDLVKIEMAGEIIPMITDIIQKGEILKTNVLTKLTKCPSCNNELNEEICNNGWKCEEQRKERFCYFVSRDCLNIAGLGEKQILFFIKNKILYYPYDLFEIKNRLNKILFNANWLGEKAIGNLLEAIEKSKYSDLISWYVSLGLPHIGRAKAEILVEKFPQFESFLETSVDDLLFFGPEIAKNVHCYKEIEKKWIKKTWEYMKIGQNFKSESIKLFDELG